MWPFVLLVLALLLFGWSVRVGVTTLQEVHHVYLGLLIFLVGVVLGLVFPGIGSGWRWVGAIVALHDAVNHGYAALWKVWPWLREITAKLDTALGKGGP